ASTLKNSNTCCWTNSSLIWAGLIVFGNAPRYCVAYVTAMLGASRLAANRMCGRLPLATCDRILPFQTSRTASPLLSFVAAPQPFGVSISSTTCFIAGTTTVSHSRRHSFLELATIRQLLFPRFDFPVCIRFHFIEHLLKLGFDLVFQ